jgi:hypothetical protein
VQFLVTAILSKLTLCGRFLSANARNSQIGTSLTTCAIASPQANLHSKERAMQLGEIIATYDVDLALRGESGKFEVTSPAGEIYYVTCKPGRLGSKTESESGKQTYAQAFLIRKIAEPIALESGSGTPAATAETALPPTPAPFLLENRKVDDRVDDDDKIMMELDSEAASMPSTLNPAQIVTAQAMTMDLFYSEGDAEQPVAYVLAKCETPEARRSNSEMLMLMTARCSTFNEFDAEVRKLHAQLDEIRLRAKKKFYRAYAAAASA